MSKIYISIAIIVLSVVAYVFVDMKLDINKLRSQNETLKNTKLTLELDLQTERDNVKLLEKTIASLQKDISVLTKSKDYFRKKYNALKEKNATERIKNEQIRNYMLSDIWNKNDCTSAKEINKWISELKYEDL